MKRQKYSSQGKVEKWLEKAPTVTLVIIAIAILTFLSVSGSNPMNYYQNYTCYGNVSRYQVNEGNHFGLLRALFVETKAMPLIANCLWLYAYGKRYEKRLDWWRFLLLFILSGLMGNAFAINANYQTVSGMTPAIFGMMVVLPVAHMMNTKSTLGEDHSMALYTIFVILVAIVSSLSTMGFLGLLGGLLGGALAAMMIFPWGHAFSTRNNIVAGVVYFAVLYLLIKP